MMSYLSNAHLSFNMQVWLVDACKNIEILAPTQNDLFKCPGRLLEQIW